MKTFIITSTLFLTFLLNPLSSRNDNNKNELDKSIRTIEIVDDCNTGVIGFHIIWTNPLASKRQVRRSFEIYGKTPSELIVNENSEFWVFNLDNMDPSVIPPNSECRSNIVVNAVTNSSDVNPKDEGIQDPFTSPF